MKADEPKHGDVSPLAGSLSALPDDGGKPAEGAGRRKEPPSEELQNFARVTPAQLAYISFAPDARYQPVRPVSARAAAAGAGKRAPRTQPAERFAGGGGILLLQDRAPGEPAEYLTFETQLPLPEAAPAAEAAGAPAAGLHIAVDPNEPEAPPPQAFEVRRVSARATRRDLIRLACSIRSARATREGLRGAKMCRTL
jgi:26S proteasome regulatory subunit N2